MTDVRLSVRVSGRVQGVGFRYFSQTVAHRLGADGWVRNEPDGSVCCEVQSDSATVEQFVAELRGGPRFSRVDEVDIESIEPLAKAVGFSIR